jgi:hypothetical protein
MRSIAEWLERLAANVMQSRDSPGFDPSGIGGAADEAVLNKVKKKSKNPPFSVTQVAKVNFSPQV